MVRHLREAKTPCLALLERTATAFDPEERRRLDAEEAAEIRRSKRVGSQRIGASREPSFRMPGPLSFEAAEALAAHLEARHAC